MKNPEKSIPPKNDVSQIQRSLLQCAEACLLGFLIFYRLAVVLCHIQALVNVAWDRLNFCSQLLLNTFQVEAIIICDQVDG